MRKLITEEDIAWVDAWAVDMRRTMAARGHSGPPRPLSWRDVTVGAEGRTCVWTAPKCQVCGGLGYDQHTGEKCPCRGPYDGGIVWKVNALNMARIPAKCIERKPTDIMRSTAKWIEEWEPAARGYILLSDPGTGKTHYMAAMTLAFIERGVKARMLDWPTFLRERKAAMGNQIRLDAQLDVIQSAPVLCIDELARERETQWTEDVLDEVIEARYQSNKTTIIASNAKPDAFEQYMGPRLYSRLISMARIVEFRGVDQRRATH